MNMLLTKRVKVKLNNRTYNYYKNLGYDFINKECEVHIEDVMKGSSVKVIAMCDICQNIKEISYKKYIKNIKNVNLYCCCEKCANIKREKTNLKKYGVKYQVQLGDFKTKSKQTKLEKYGDEKYTNRDKYKETCMIKYNVENVFKLEMIKEKSYNTKVEKYNDGYYVNKEKTKKTKLEKYGDEYYNNPEKYLETCLNKYNIRSTLQLITKEERIKNTKQWFKNNPLEKEKRKKWMSSDIFKKLSKDKIYIKYGVYHIMHVDDVVLKNHISGMWSKKYKDTDLYYRVTYEFDFLENFYDKFEITNAKSIIYNFDGKDRRYYPDFFIKELNLLVEIKSEYTYNINLLLNMAKHNACDQQGFKHIFIIDKNYTDFKNMF